MHIRIVNGNRKILSILNKIELSAFLFSVIFIASIFCDFQYTKNLQWLSDFIQAFDEMLSVRSGNFGLGGWTLSIDNFYFTDLPFSVMLSYLMGPNISIVYLAPFLVFILLLMVCLLIVSSRTRTNAERYVGLYAALFTVGLPYTPWTQMFLLSNIHIGTIMFCVFAALIGGPALECPSFNRLRFFPFSALTFCATASDPFADVFFVAPLVITCLLRAWIFQKISVNETFLAGLAAISAVAGMLFVEVIRHFQGFQISTLYLVQNFVSNPAELANDFYAFCSAMKILFSAQGAVLIGITNAGLIGTTRLVIMLIYCLLCLRAILRMPREPQNGFVHWLILSAACVALADTISGAFAVAITAGPSFPNQAIRYVIPAFVFLSLAGIIELARVASSIKLPFMRTCAVAAVAVLAAPFLYGAAQTASRQFGTPSSISRDPSAQLATWLKSHGLYRGFGDYWTSQMVLAQSLGQIHIAPVQSDGKQFTYFQWNSDVHQFNFVGRPQFVAFLPNAWGLTVADTEAVYGAAQGIYSVGPYTVIQVSDSAVER